MPRINKYKLVDIYLIKSNFADIDWIRSLREYIKVSVGLIILFIALLLIVRL